MSYQSSMFCIEQNYHPHISGQTNLLQLSRKLWMHTGLPNIKKQILVYILLLHFHLCLRSCLVTGVIVYACWLLRCISYFEKRNFLLRYLRYGAWTGKLFCLVMIINFLLWHLLQLFQPSVNIEEVPDTLY